MNFFESGFGLVLLAVVSVLAVIGLFEVLKWIF